MRTRAIILHAIGCLYFAGVVPAESPENLSAWLEPIRNSAELPALAAGVIVDGELKAYGATGVRKWGDTTAVTRDDQFHLGSCTKAMTATVIALLVQDGKLAWDTPLSEHFSEWKNTMRPAYMDVTLKHLLMHRAGVPTYTIDGTPAWERLDALTGTPTEQRYEAARRLLQEEPTSTPGTEYRYANEGYVIAGAIAERAAGVSFEKLITERLFKPLGMTSAGFGPMGSLDQIDQPWQHIRNGKEHVAVSPDPKHDNPPLYCPAGTVHANMPDWGRFLLLHLDGTIAGKPFLTPDSLSVLHTPEFGGDYAMGWQVVKREWGGTVLTHSGSNTQNFCVVWTSPERRFSVFVATNEVSKDFNEARTCDEVCGMLVEQYLLKTKS